MCSVNGDHRPGQEPGAGLIDALQQILQVRDLVAFLAHGHLRNDHPGGMVGGSEVVASGPCAVLRTAGLFPVNTEYPEVRLLMEGFLRIAWWGFTAELPGDPLGLGQVKEAGVKVGEDAFEGVRRGWSVEELFAPVRMRFPEVHRVFIHLGVGVVVGNLRGGGQAEQQVQWVSDAAALARVGQQRQELECRAVKIRILKFCVEIHAVLSGRI